MFLQTKKSMSISAENLLQRIGLIAGEPSTTVADAVCFSKQVVVDSKEECIIVYY
jgi:hypothetical protein